MKIQVYSIGLDLHTKQTEAYLYGMEASQVVVHSVDGSKEESLIGSADEGRLDPSVGECDGEDDERGGKAKDDDVGQRRHHGVLPFPLPCSLPVPARILSTPNEPHTSQHEDDLSLCMLTALVPLLW